MSSQEASIFNHLLTSSTSRTSSCPLYSDLQDLEGRGLVRAQRGATIITDRQGLIEASNRSHGLAESEYNRLLGAVKMPADAEALEE